jgi:ABC-type dipeptide/oligopeptide/nickel transport system ATPase component
MKIAISGSSGCGKSTLTQALAERLNIAAIKEGYEPLYEVKFKREFPPKLIAIFNHKLALEHKHQHFVSDRCPIDLLNTWLNQSCHKIVPKITDDFFGQCVKHMQSYDFLIIPAWNTFKLQQNNEILPRDMNIMEQLRSHTALVGHAHMWLPITKIIELPQTQNTVEKRLAFILNIIKKRRPELLQDASV